LSNLKIKKMNTASDSPKNRMLVLSFIPLAIAINVGIGAIVKILNLPIYMDSIGTIIATLLLGWRSGAIVGVLGFVITSIFINPFAIYFIFTQIVIALVVDFFAKRKWFSNIWKIVLSGIGLGITTAIASAPIIILLFQGATGNGAALVTSFFVQMGNQIINSVFLSGLSIEPVDKVIQCLLAIFILKGVPKSSLEEFNSISLRKNQFIS
jgi:energy-coupling factor transport system substrate-specific component